MLNLTRIVVSCDPKFYWCRPVGYGKNVEFCTLVAKVTLSYSSHVALSQHLLSFLFIRHCVRKEDALISLHLAAIPVWLSVNYSAAASSLERLLLTSLPRARIRNDKTAFINASTGRTRERTSIFWDMRCGKPRCHEMSNMSWTFYNHTGLHHTGLQSPARTHSYRSTSHWSTITSTHTHSYRSTSHWSTITSAHTHSYRSLHHTGLELAQHAAPRFVPFHFHAGCCSRKLNLGLVLCFSTSVVWWN